MNCTVDHVADGAQPISASVLKRRAYPLYHVLGTIDVDATTPDHGYRQSAAKRQALRTHREALESPSSGVSAVTNGQDEEPIWGRVQKYLDGKEKP